MNALKRKVDDEIDSNQEVIPERDIQLPKKVKNIKEDEVADEVEEVVADEVEDENICCFCLETIKKTNNVKTSCNHNFCFSCILEHLKNKNTCPYCRTPIEPVRKKNDLIRHAQTLFKLNIEQNVSYIKPKIDKIKDHLVLSIIDVVLPLINNENTPSTIDANFQRDILNITNSETFKYNMRRFLLKEIINLSEHLSLNNINNIIQWLNQ